MYYENITIKKMMINIVDCILQKRGKYIILAILHMSPNERLKLRQQLITLSTSTRSLVGSSELAGMFWCFSCSLRSLSFLISCKLCLSEAVSPSESLSRKSKTEVSEELRKPRSLAWITPSLGVLCSSSGLQNNLKSMRLVVEQSYCLNGFCVFCILCIFRLSKRLFLLQQMQYNKLSFLYFIEIFTSHISNRKPFC